MLPFQAVVYDYENDQMYGGADNTREGTVLGVDRIAYTSKGINEIKVKEKGPFTFKVNNYVYPYETNQMKIINGKPYIQSDKLLLGLGVIDTSELKTYKTDNKSYLSIIKTAKALGYIVDWNEKDSVLQLKKDYSYFNDLKADEDSDIITN